MSDEQPSLKTAIETWSQKRLTVYRASGEQIRIDANSAEAVTKDHVNRWLFELIQNADDAGANEVKVRVTATTVYFADDGEGLKPGAIFGERMQRHYPAVSRRRPTSPLN